MAVDDDDDEDDDDDGDHDHSEYDNGGNNHDHYYEDNAHDNVNDASIHSVFLLPDCTARLQSKCCFNIVTENSVELLGKALLSRCGKCQQGLQYGTITGGVIGPGLKTGVPWVLVLKLGCRGVLKIQHMGVHGLLYLV